MAIQLEGNIEALRIYEYLTKVLGTSDLENYFVLIDKSGEIRAQKVSLASLLAFSSGGVSDTEQAWSSTIQFDGSYGSFNTNEHEQTGDIIFSFNWTNAIFGAVTSRTIIGDGNNLIIPISNIESINANGASGTLVGNIFTTIANQRYRIMFECSDVANELVNVFIIDADLLDIIASYTPKMWYRGSDSYLFTLSGSDITNISSKDPATIPASTDGGNEPTYNSGIVEFRLANVEYLKINNVATYINDHTDEFTIALVYTNRNTGVYTPILWIERQISINSRFGIQINNSDEIAFQKRNTSSNTVNQSIGASAENDEHIVVFSHNSSEELTAYYDGSKTVDAVDVSTPAFDYTLDIASLGRLYNAASPVYGNVDIKEIILYTSALTDDQMNGIMETLNNIYNVY